MKSHKRPLNRSITIGCVAFIIVLCILLSLANPVLYQNYVFQDYRDYISDLLLYTLDHIDGDDLKAINGFVRKFDRSKHSNNENRMTIKGFGETGVLETVAKLGIFLNAVGRKS